MRTSNKVKIRIQQPLQFVIKAGSIKELTITQHLRVVSLCKQDLVQLPHELTQCDLEALVLDNNYIIDCSWIQQFPNLKHLSVQNNKIRSIEVSESLRFVNLRNNQVESIDCKYLDYLDIRNNHLMKIYVEPTRKPKTVLLGWIHLLSDISKYTNKGQNIESRYDIESLTLQCMSGTVRLKSFLLKILQLFNESSNQPETEESERHYSVDSKFKVFIKTDALHQCVINNELHLFKQLLTELDINPSGKDLQSQTPLTLAIRLNRLDMIDYLLPIVNLSKETESFHQAIKGGQVALVKHFLDSGAKVDHYNSRGYTPLTTAILNITQVNMRQIVQLLILCGANPNYHNKNGSTTFQMCLVKSNVTALKFILQYNQTARSTRLMFRLNLRDSFNGDSSMHVAARNKSLPSMLFLLENQIGNLNSINYLNQNTFSLIGLCEKSNKVQTVQSIVISKLLSKVQKLQLVMHFSKSVTSNVQQMSLPQRMDSCSSCPNLSDDDMVESEKPPILAFLTYQSGQSLNPIIKQAIYEDSDDGSDNSEESIDSCQEVQYYPSVQQFKHLQKFSQASIANNSHNQTFSKKVCKLLIMFQKRRLKLAEITRIINKPQLSDLVKLRMEVGLLLMVKQYNQYIDWEQIQVSGFHEYLQMITEQIRTIECNQYYDELKQYCQLQYN